MYLLRRFFRRKTYQKCFSAVIIICLFYLLIIGNIQSENNRSLEEIQIRDEFIKKDQDDLINTDTYRSQFSRFNKIKNIFQAENHAKNANHKRIFENERRDNMQDEYLILEYTKFWQQKKFCHVKSDDLYVKQCPYKNCRFTCDKERVNKADAVLFHEADVNEEILKDKGYIKRVAGIRNSPSQVFMLWNDEANVVKEALDQIKFNWTISYRLDSEISDCAYGCIYEKNQLDLNKNNLLLDEFIQKKDQALWFVSNCDSKYRIDFANKIRETFPVKVYGQCKLLVQTKQVLNLSRDSLLGLAVYGLANFFARLYEYGKCNKYSNCEIEEIKNSKFYFSFESKNCSNLYITEKFFRILRYNVIPVVIQPNRVFYEKIAPPNSFIHAADFDYDARKLAEYLEKVAGDYNLFVKYMAWKVKYETVHIGKSCEARRLCELCTRLNQEKKEIYYESVSKWFNKGCILN